MMNALEIYDVISRQSFADFVAEDGDFINHISGADDALSKDEILKRIAKMFSVDVEPKKKTCVIELWTDHEGHEFDLELEEVIRLMREGNSSGFSETENEDDDDNRWASGFSFDEKVR